MQKHPWADIGSDHNTLSTKVSVRLNRAMPSSKKNIFLDLGQLLVPEIKEKYLIEVKNKYEKLSLEPVEQEDSSSKSEIKWKLLKESIEHANTTAPKLE